MFLLILPLCSIHNFFPFPKFLGFSFFWINSFSLLSSSPSFAISYKNILEQSVETKEDVLIQPKSSCSLG